MSEFEKGDEFVVIDGDDNYFLKTGVVTNVADGYIFVEIEEMTNTSCFFTSDQIAHLRNAKAILKEKYPRKIVQISTASLPESHTTPYVVTALCDDGSLWELWDSDKWTRLPDIPQG